MNYYSRARALVKTMAADRDLSLYIDHALESPTPFGFDNRVHLVILGQDPTVKESKSRQGITTVLNLDKKGGALYRYLNQTCSSLGVTLDKEVYATNIVNCFFVRPPTSLPKNVLQQAFALWRDLLREELASFPAVPVVCLGEPALMAYS